MNQDSRVIMVVALVGALGVGGFLWWRNYNASAPLPPRPAPIAAAPAPAPPAPAVPPPAAPEPAIKHPVAAPAEKAPPLPALEQSDSHITAALTDLLGKKGVISFLALDGFARRFVATVDNLDKERAPLLQWPVKPTPGPFLAEPRGASTVVSSANSARYQPFIDFALGVEPRKLGALYLRLYPLFQQAYEELGYPDKYFNDRVIEIIDHLLATPAVPDPVRLKQVVITDSAGRSKPGSLYQFEDPSLESRSAGQKLLLRLGSNHAVRATAALGELRAQLTGGAAQRRIEKSQN